MKKLLFVILLACIFSPSNSQILKKVLDRTKQKTEDKIAEKVSEKASDAATKPIDDAGKDKDKKKDSKDGSTSTNSTNSTTGNGAGDNAAAAAGASTATLATYSKYDFVPGEKILVVEDFAQDAIGDFPTKWNTNGSGEVVTASGQTGHWLMINKKGKFIPEFITALPDNFTFQCDVICNEKFSFYSNALQLFFMSGGQKGAMEYSFIALDKRSGVELGIHPADAGSKGGTAFINTYEDGNKVMYNQLATTQFDANANKTKVKLSVWRQKQRIRVYINEEKVFDMPRAFAAGKTYDLVFFEIWSGMNNDVDRYLINNITLAVGAPDTRNKLITEGKFSTTGILFDVNSDKIKPESYGVLKDIANVLTENSTVKIKIVGHTDSDGDDNSNLELSKKRAAAVKNALSNEFKIDAGRMETDGMGEKQPVGDNKTTEGKANNRRVEFIKM